MRCLGRIFERPPGSGNLWIAYYHRGKEIRESVAKQLGKPNKRVTEPDAERALKRRIKEMAGGRFCGPQQDRVTVAEVLDHYERERRMNGTNLRSICPRLKVIRHGLGALRVVDLGPTRIKAWRDELLTRGRHGIAYKPSTVNGTLAYLHAALMQAQEDELIAFVPRVPRLRNADNPRQGFFEVAEFWAVYERLGHEVVRDIVHFLYRSGWRHEEATGLRWEWVDRARGRVIVPDTKNDEGAALPLVDDRGQPNELGKIVERRWREREYRRRDGTTGLSEWVFHRHGKRIVDFRWQWRRACNEAGVGHKIPHDFRRTAVRDLVDAGVDPHVAMSITHHKDPKMLKRYNIVDTRRMAVALRRADDYREAQRAMVSSALVPAGHGQIGGRTRTVLGKSTSCQEDADHSRVMQYHPLMSRASDCSGGLTSDERRPRR